MDEIIDQRQEDISKIAGIMKDIKEIGQDFNTEVEVQGEKLEHMNSELEQADNNAAGAHKEMVQANDRHRRSGKCLLVLALIIVLALAGLLAILFGTKII